MARKSRKHLYDCDVTPVEETCFRAAAYLRISGDDKKKRGDSIETQRNIIENFIATTHDIKLHETYIDDNITGMSLNRPGFQKMLTDAENGKINCIIVKDLTRFGRNAIDSGYYLEKHLPSLSIRFISITDNYDSIDGDGGILLPLKMILNESYALDIGRKCHATWRQNILDGRFIGRVAPYGYKKSPDDCHQLIIDEETAPIVKRIFDWIYNDESITGIARQLNDDKIPSPARYNYAKGYNKSEKLLGSIYWKPGMITRMLADRVYIGHMAQGKTRTINHVKVNIDPSEWICVENTHEPIISLKVFNYVQELLQESKEVNQMRKKMPLTPNIYLGKVICAKCGYVMKRKKQENHDYYWFRCESQWKYSINACTVVSVKETDLKEKIMTILQKHSEVINGELININNAINIQEKNKLNLELNIINKELGANSRMIKSLYESLIGNLITSDEYTRMKSEYEAKISELSSRADTIRNTQMKLDKKKEHYESIADVVNAVIENDTINAEIMDLLVDKIVVNPDKSFEVFFNYKDELGKVCA